MKTKGLSKRQVADSIARVRQEADKRFASLMERMELDSCHEFKLPAKEHYHKGVVDGLELLFRGDGVKWAGQTALIPQLKNKKFTDGHFNNLGYWRSEAVYETQIREFKARLGSSYPYGGNLSTTKGRFIKVKFWKSGESTVEFPKETLDEITERAYKESLKYIEKVGNVYLRLKDERNEARLESLFMSGFCKAKTKKAGEPEIYGKVKSISPDPGKLVDAVLGSSTIETSSSIMPHKDRSSWGCFLLIKPAPLESFMNKVEIIPIVTTDGKLTSRPASETKTVRMKDLETVYMDDVLSALTQFLIEA